MTTQYPVRPLYYRHSGKYALSGLALTLAGGGLAAISLSALYAYIVLYIPIAGWITFLITGAFAFVIGWITGTLLYKTKTRNIPISALVAALVATAAYVGAWVFWLYAFCQRNDANAGPDDGKIEMTFFELFANPARTWSLIKAINENGAWSLKDHTPTGIELGVIWFLEAGIIYAVSIAIAISRVSAVPFCEHCQRWGITKDLVNTARGSDAELRHRIESRDFACLETLGPVTNPDQWYHIALQGCPDCDTTQTLCIDRTTITRNSKGEKKVNKKAIIKRLWLAPEELIQVAQTAAAVQAAATTPPAPAPEPAPASAPTTPPANKPA